MSLYSLAARREFRLLVPPPMSDETTSSFLDRAAAFHGISRAQLISCLEPTIVLAKHCPDIDSWRFEEFSMRIMKALGCEGYEKQPIPMITPFNSMKPEVRCAYCPLCFEEDLAKNRSPYFRAVWAHTFVTICLFHDAPLCEWRQSGRLSREMPREWTVRPCPKKLGLADGLEKDIHFASNVREMADRFDTPYGKLVILQKLLTQQANASSAFTPWNLNTYVIRGFHAALADGINAEEGCEPLASTKRPRNERQGLFENIPPKWPRRLSRNSILSLQRYRSLGWRRSALVFAAERLTEMSAKNYQ